MTDYDPFAPQPDAPRGKTDFDGTVVLARFHQEDRGNYALHVTFDIPDDPDPGPDPYVQRYGLGKDWVSYDGGESVQYPGDPNRGFHRLTTYYDFITFAMKTDVKDELMRRNRELYDNHGPAHAAIWEGLGFHMDAVLRPRAQLDEDTKEWVDGYRTLPTKGWVVGESGLTTPKPVPDLMANLQTSLGMIETQDLAHIIRVAKSSTDISQFADKVMDSESVTGVKMASVQAIMNQLTPGWFEQLKGS